MAINLLVPQQLTEEQAPQILKPGNLLKQRVIHADRYLLLQPGLLIVQKADKVQEHPDVLLQQLLTEQFQIQEPGKRQILYAEPAPV